MIKKHKSRAADLKNLAIIVPVFNEEEVLPRFWERLRPVFARLHAQGVNARAFFVDDGSTDSTLECLRRMARGDKRVGYVSFSRNFGHQIAVISGLREADADAYVVMDSDLQDPPELLPDLAVAWAEGWQVVYCVRRNRKEGALLKAAYKVFYRLLATISYLRIPLDSGDFCLMDRRVVEELRRMGEHNPFVRGMRAWVGFRQRALEYDRSERAGGESKYPLRKLMALAYDGVISFSFVPLRSAMHLGYLVAAASFLAMCYIVFKKLFWGISLSGWTSLVSIMLFLGGIQLLTLGFIGEYLARVFDEVKGRPLYVVKERKR